MQCNIINLYLFQSERILSFIPPDGNFRLMSYHIGSQSVVAIPIYVRHNLTLRSNGDQGRLDLTVGPKQTMGRTLESKDMALKLLILITDSSCVRESPLQFCFL